MKIFNGAALITFNYIVHSSSLGRTQAVNNSQVDRNIPTAVVQSDYHEGGWWGRYYLLTLYKWGMISRVEFEN